MSFSEAQHTCYCTYQLYLHTDWHYCTTHNCSQLLGIIIKKIHNYIMMGLSLLHESQISTPLLSILLHKHTLPPALAHCSLCVVNEKYNDCIGTVSTLWLVAVLFQIMILSQSPFKLQSAVDFSCLTLMQISAIQGSAVTLHPLKWTHNNSLSIIWVLTWHLTHWVLSKKHDIVGLLLIIALVWHKPNDSNAESISAWNLP